MKVKTLEYREGNTLLEGYLAYDEKQAGKRPAVLIAHDWTGRNEFACQKAEKIAELGYVGFALDMYGKGVLGRDNDEKMQLITPFMEDRNLLRKRVTAALQALHEETTVDTHRVAAMGFCFGGLCALDLARSGADIRGVVSFHGLLNAPERLPNHPIKAKILALHGHDDPMVTPDHVSAFQQEMTNAKVDWQMHIYGNTMHSFTNPVANDPAFGTVYNTVAEKRSWIAMKNFFAEIL